MRSCGSSSSPTAHITFCTLTEVFRPQILIMALPSLARDGRFVVPAIHRCARGRKQAARRQPVGVAKLIVNNNPQTMKLRPRPRPTLEGCARSVCDNTNPQIE